MKNSILLSILALPLLLTGCKSQQPAAVDYHPIVQAAKETSLYADRVDWPQVNARFQELIEGKQTPAELQPGLEYLLNRLGDKHATFRSAKDYSIIAHFTGTSPSEDTRPRDGKFINTVINDVTAKFSYQLLEGNIGYLKVVGIGPGATVKEQADEIRAGIMELDDKQVERWILDLRYNGGGNMNPMMAGLAPLVGEGFVGGAVNAQDSLVQRYTIAKGEFYDNGRLACPMKNLPRISPDEKVAVLLSRYTVSSGELVAVAFKGRENTIFIGENTGGYVTGNGWQPVSEELVMLISQSIFADRNGNVYAQNVGVDIPMKFNLTGKLSTDLQIQKAIEWLNE